MIVDYLNNYIDKVLTDDLYALAESDIPWELLANSSIMITGATGMIGSQIVKSLLFANEKYKLDLNLYIIVRNKEKALAIFQGFLDSNIQIIIGDILEMPIIEDKIDYIIHGASITSSQDFVRLPVDTIKTSVLGSMNMLELAKEKKVKSFIYLSSLEVYGSFGEELTNIHEKNYGYIDVLNVRSSYSESKRLVENLCISYGEQFGIPVKIARLSQTFGAGVEYNDNRVYAQFARCIIEKKDIILHTKGDTIRNYCYTRDAIKAILTIMLRGANNSAYNVANKETTISIREMALSLVKQYQSLGLNVKFDLESEINHGFNPIVKIKLDTSKLEQLGWKAEVNLENMFDRMISSMTYRK